MSEIDPLDDRQAFFATQCERLARLDIEVALYPVGHLAVRVASMGEYESVRERLERISVANVENEWNGRPISKLLLRHPLRLGPRHTVALIELIPPPHQASRVLGLEHVGFVLGDAFDAFAERYRALTVQQDQGPHNQPLVISFNDGTSVKFHRYSLQEVLIREGRLFDGFYRAVPVRDPGA